MTSTLYDIHQDFPFNVTFGPFFNEKLPSLKSPKQKIHFLGHELDSAFGISCCPMTFTARNIGICAKLGYDLITYRSVRSVEWHGLPAPNWCYVDVPNRLKKEDLVKPVIGSLEPFPNQEVSTANSFGIQSFKPEYWQAEYEVAKSKLLPGQVLMLSLMITPEDGKRDALSDAIEVTKLAMQTSADIFEINLACPNSGTSALIYEDIELCIKICQEMKKLLGEKKLLAKVGYYSDMNDLKRFMEQTKGVLDGLTSTNTYSMKVTDSAGKEIFPGRATAGVSGAAIRDLCMEQAKMAVQFKKELQLSDFVIIGVGGVISPEHIQEYLALGVDAVQAAAGVWADPFLASKYKEYVK